MRDLEGWVRWRLPCLAWPQWRSYAIAEMLGPLIHGPMVALSEAIKAGDAGGFATAYGRLTEACNACHQATDRGVVTIRVPDGSSFPDQEFKPAAR